MAIRTQTLTLGRQLRTTVGGYADDATRTLTAAWVAAWDALHTELVAAVNDVFAQAARFGRWPSARELARIQRLGSALDAAQETLAGLAAQAGTTITQAATRTVHDTAGAEPDIIASQLPAAERAAASARAAGRILPRALDVIVARTASQITASTRALSQPAVEAMNRQLVIGVATGTNPNQVATRMLSGLHDAFNGGLDRAVNIARTEILDAYRVTSQYAHQANADVLDGWIWLCTLSARTCPACLAMNGSEHPLEEPGPLDHPSGRCARMPKVKSWEALGITTAEPAHIIPDARAWFAAQPEGVQLQIMGPGRLAALKSGDASWESLATRRENAGWRPSYVTTPLKNLTTGGGPGSSAGAPLPQRTPPAVTPLPQRTPPTVTPPGTPPASGAGDRLPVGDIIVRSWPDVAAHKDRINAAVRQIFERDFAGLTVQVEDVALAPHLTIITGDIRDADDDRIGHVIRQYQRETDGTLVAQHAYLTLNKTVRGQGFATAFNGHLEDWYRDSGVDRIELLANIDVGGYTWGRDGYDFAHESAAVTVIGRLEDQLGIYEGMAEMIQLDIDAGDGNIGALTAELARVNDQISTGEAIVEAAQTHTFGELGYPTAYEISQAGRWPGATRTDVWIGKAAMLGSKWSGVKPL